MLAFRATKTHTDSRIVNNGASRASEIEFLGEWCALIVHFLGTVAPSGVMRQLESAVVGARQRADAPGLAAIAEDLAAWVSALGATRQRELDALLRARFGRGLDSGCGRAERVPQPVSEGAAGKRS